MMFLSRIWYVVLSLVVATSLYCVFLAVGEYNRRGTVAMTEELASDVQVVGWNLQIDARHRLDALLYGSLDPGIQAALGAAQDKDKIPAKAKDDAKKALVAVNEKIQPAEFRSDALFAVDHDGRVIGQVGFDQANAFDDFELGGYPAVNDAIHGFLRDDIWVLGGKIYRVVARPVEFDSTQRPLGAVVGLKAVDNKFAQELSKRTRTSVVFYAGGQRVASAAAEGLDVANVDQAVTLLPKLAQDKAYTDGRSDVQFLGEEPAAPGAIFARLAGDAWEGGAGFAVVRPRAALAGPMGILNGADDKDKQGVNLPILALVLVVGSVFGILFSFLEHSLPLREMVAQAEKLKRGELDYLQLPRFRGGYRGIAQDINAGIERVLEKGGGAARKPADLASILGPVPAQPAMSAFSFPLPDANPPPQAPAAPPPPQRPTGSQPRPFPGGGPALPPPQPPSPSRPNFPVGNPVDSPTLQAGQSPVLPKRNAPTMMGVAPPPPSGNQVATSPAFYSPARAPSPSHPQLGNTPLPISNPQPPQQQSGFNMPMPPLDDGADERDEATVIAPAPSDLLAAVDSKGGESAEWLSVYDDFVRTKKQCNEPTDGLTFEKFQHTLKKNRDALIQRHGCKRVRFSVYVKEGRASLKATPVRE